MKVRALISFAGMEVSMMPGEIREIPDRLASDYIKGGLVVEVKEGKSQTLPTQKSALKSTKSKAN